ncbi:hypothetical protein MRX96_037630 [Rhipicephalus microplus]
MDVVFFSVRREKRFARGLRKQECKRVFQGKGHGMPLKSTGPPSPASASSKLMMAAVAASSFSSLLS